MTTVGTAIIEIVQFHDCEGCIGRVKDTLHKIGGVELLEMDPGKGKFTVSTTKHPDAIILALNLEFRKRKIVKWSKYIIYQPPPPLPLPLPLPSAPPMPTIEDVDYGNHAWLDGLCRALMK